MSVIALANAITNLTRLDISYTNLCAEGGKALGEALKGNTVLQELNIAGNQLIYHVYFEDLPDNDLSGIIAICDAIPTMRELRKVDVSKNHIFITDESLKIWANALKKSTSLTHLNISANPINTTEEKYRGIIDAIIANQKLTTLIFAGVDDYVDRTTKFSNSNRSEPAILEVGMTEANLSNTRLGCSGATIVSRWISEKDSASMKTLDISNNTLGGQCSVKIAEALRTNTVLKVLNIHKTYANSKCAKILKEGVIANGNLKTLDISNNSISYDVRNDIENICKAKRIRLTL